MTFSLRCKLALACVPLVLVACGGDGDAPVSADTQAPYVVLTTVGITSGIAYLEATAGDNVKVTAVQFLIDGNVVLGDTQHNNDGTWLHEMDATHIPAGTHTVTAVALDAAGNSGAGTTSLVVAAPASATPDTVPPVAAAAVDGNFGLVKLTAIATDDVQVSSVLFFVDGQPTGYWAGQSYMGTDPANQYFTVFDTTALSNGPHQVFARVEDTSGNQTDSAAVVLTVDDTAGLVESEPNDTIATANVVAAGQAQVSGAMNSVVANPSAPDVDFYKVNVPAGKTLVVDMLQVGDFVVQLVGADGTVLSAPEVMTASAVNTVSYANGAAARDVFIQVTSGGADLGNRNRYRLSLSTH